MRKIPEALRLADALDAATVLDEVGSNNQLAKNAADELRRLYEEVNQLNLAEEGAKEAYGVVVIKKKIAEADSKDKARTIFLQQEVIVKMRQQRDELLEALKLALPSINPKAVDRKRVQDTPIDDCYVNTIVRKVIEKVEGTV